MESGTAKLDAALAACGLHAQVPGDAAAALPEVFNAEMAATVDADRHLASWAAGANPRGTSLPIHSARLSITFVITETTP